MFSVAVPHQSAIVTSIGDWKPNVGVAAYEKEGIDYSVKYTDLTLTPESADPVKFHTDFLLMVQNSFEGKDRTLKPVVHDDVSGYEFEYDVVNDGLKKFSEQHGLTPPDLSFTARRTKGRYFLIGTRLFNISATYERKRRDDRSDVALIDARIQGFLNSLILLKNPEIENYGVLDGYVYTNKKLGFSLALREPGVEGSRWYYSIDHYGAPLAETSGPARVGLTPVTEKNAHPLLFSAEITTPQRRPSGWLQLRLLRTNAQSDAKLVAADLRNELRSDPKFIIETDLVCGKYDGSTGCTFDASDLPIGDEPKNSVSPRQANPIRYYVIKLSDATFLLVKWRVLSRNRALRPMIDETIKGFKMIK